MMLLLAALSNGRHHRQRGGCASSFRGGVPGHLSSIISVRGSFRLAHTHHSSLLPRTLARWGESGLRLSVLPVVSVVRSMDTG